MDTLDAGLKCTNCGTYMDGADLDATCRFCGTRLSDLLNLDLVDRGTLAVAADVPCVKCQYNLRTIPISSQCPECGTAVTSSLARGELRHANAGWLSRIRGALALLAGAFFLLIANEIISTLTPLMVSPFSGLAWFSQAVIGLVSSLLLCLGCLAVVRPEPAEAAARPAGTARLLRASAVGVLVLTVAGWALPFISYACANGWTGLRHATLTQILTQGTSTSLLLHLFLWITSMVLAIAVLVLLDLRLRALAIRAKRPVLRQTLNVLLGLIVLQALARSTMLLMFLPMARGGMLSWYPLSSCAQRLTHLLVNIIMLVACLRLAQLFGRAIAGRSTEREVWSGNAGGKPWP